jgi:hypothetical protein
MDGRFPHVAAYRQRLMARPAFKRAIDEARHTGRFSPAARRTGTDVRDGARSGTCTRLG